MAFPRKSKIARLEAVMNMTEIRERAATVGIGSISKLRKAELIREIQRTEGNNPCYGIDWRHSCAEMFCCWRDDCLKE
jgi:hypothetical protein